MTLDRQPVKGGFVRSVGYDAASRVLQVEMNSIDARMPGTVYEYSNVPPDAHQRLLGALDMTEHYRHYIRGRYQGRQISSLRK